MRKNVKDEYFEIVQGLNTWIMDKLEGYEYNKLDDPNYQLTTREKEGLVSAQEMLDRISKNTLAA
jgi:hypothetical protein